MYSRSDKNHVWTCFCSLSLLFLLSSIFSLKKNIKEEEKEEEKERGRDRKAVQTPFLSDGEYLVYDYIGYAYGRLYSIDVDNSVFMRYDSA